jgi:hypothetical protein
LGGSCTILGRLLKECIGRLQLADGDPDRRPQVNRIPIAIEGNQRQAPVELGQDTEGLAQMYQGLTDDRGTGAVLGLPGVSDMYAEACLQAGQRDAGLLALDEAFEAAYRSGERLYEVRLHRLKGELLLQDSVGGSLTSFRTEEVEATFQRGPDIAHQQNARSLELRAALSLSRLLRQQGNIAEARVTLAEIYSGFTEEFGTRHLQEFRKLLTEIEGRSR